jgi:hypothetical protein
LQQNSEQQLHVRTPQSELQYSFRLASAEMVLISISRQGSKHSGQAACAALTSE